MRKKALRRGQPSLQWFPCGLLLRCLLTLLGFALGFLLCSFSRSLHGGLGLGQRAGGLLVGLDVAGQMLAEFGIEFLGASRYR